MDRVEAHQQLVRLLGSVNEETVNTSVRFPVRLREAAGIAAKHLGIAQSTSALTVEALRRLLEQTAFDVGLELFFEASPDSRPTLAEVSSALAVLEGWEFAGQEDEIAKAADEVLSRHPDAEPRDVLLWLEAQKAFAAA